MPKKLTVAIPTFNRAELLDKQLSWLQGAIRGHEDECEVIISDNASTDNTDAVISRHTASLVEAGVDVSHVRQRENLGAIRNIAYCINNGTGEYVWTISDDDEIADDAIDSILEWLRRHDDLSVLILNFSSRHHRTGRRKFARCFPNKIDEVASNGSTLFERYLDMPDPSRWGGLALTTALVYHTASARAALRSWPQGLSNLTVQLYVTGYCARRGKTIVTHETMLEMIGGRHFFESDRLYYAQFRFAQVPEAFVQLLDLGYPPELLRRKILGVPREARAALLRELLIKHPIHSAAILARYVNCLATVQPLLMRLRGTSLKGLAVEP